MIHQAAWPTKSLVPKGGVAPHQTSRYRCCISFSELLVTAQCFAMFTNLIMLNLPHYKSLGELWAILWMQRTFSSIMRKLHWRHGDWVVLKGIHEKGIAKQLSVFPGCRNYVEHVYRAHWQVPVASQEVFSSHTLRHQTNLPPQFQFTQSHCKQNMPPPLQIARRHSRQAAVVWVSALYYARAGNSVGNQAATDNRTEAADSLINWLSNLKPVYLVVTSNAHEPHCVLRQQ